MADTIYDWVNEWMKKWLKYESNGLSKSAFLDFFNYDSSKRHQKAISKAFLNYWRNPILNYWKLKNEEYFCKKSIAN